MNNYFSKGLSLSLSAYLRTALLNRFKACTGDFYTYTVIANTVKQSLFARLFSAQDCRVANAPRNDGRKSVQYGRSMIEMLGVLAIIGVLSVGGIAGYTKAMQSYRSNMQKYQLASLMASAIRLKPHLNSKVKSVSVVPAIDALNLIPDGLTLSGNTLKDAYGNSITIFYGVNTWANDQAGTSYSSALQYTISLTLAKETSTLTPEGDTFCMNAILLAKQYAGEISSIQSFQGSKDPEDWRGYKQTVLFQTTNPSLATYLPNAGMAAIKQKCHTCTEQATYCRLAIYLKP